MLPMITLAAAGGAVVLLLVARVVIGRLDPPADPGHTPFKDEDGATIWYPPPLQQVTPKDFLLTRPFTYRDRSGTRWTISGDVLNLTDYASIPWFLRWFVSRYGAHTLAAVMHDQLVDSDRLERRHADRLFHEALQELGVPPVRRNLMWAAVTLRTRFEPAATARFGAMVLWSVLAVVGVVCLAVGLASGTWWLAVVAVLAPLPASLLWGADRWPGVVAGYGLVFLAPSSIMVVATYAAYWLSDPARRTQRVGPEEL